MSKELQVIVQQTPGTIHWNFEELKAGLAEKMKDYKNIVYTEDTVTAAKQDVAMLRKLKKSVEDRRKEIKNKCLEPYSVIEDQAKQLTGLIDEPIKSIAEQIDAYETRRREAKKEAIMKYMTEAFKELDPLIAKRLQFKVYDSRWENKGCSDGEWQGAVNEAAKNTQGDINVLNGIEEEFRQTCMDVYATNLVLNEALQKANELRRQKEMILERERQRQEALKRQKEAEERRKAEEQARAEERARAEAQARAEAKARADAERLKANTAQEAQTAAKVTPFPQAANSRPMQTESQHEAVRMPQTQTAQQVEPQKNAEGRYTIIFSGNQEQLKKVLGYIKWIGASGEVLRNAVDR